MYKFFWNGVFSNWHPCKFEYFGVQFTSSEQAFMYEKALFFNDSETAELILKTDNPREQKQLGRKVVNYDEHEWNEVRYVIMMAVLVRKFNQNPDLLNELRTYKGFEFVEASPYDRIWGIGYSEYDALDHINDWGENLLGKILTELSQTL